MFKHKPNKGEHMLDNVESNQPTETNKPIVDTAHELKWKRTVRRHAINILALIENDGEPTQQMNYQIRKLHEAFTYWNSDVATWVKHRMVLPTTPPVPQTELQKPEVEPIDTDGSN
jgi:hypothetical protein